jgi:hypothetical protein
MTKAIFAVHAFLAMGCATMGRDPDATQVRNLAPDESRNEDGDIDPSLASVLKPGVATLGCNIHDRMSAHIVVVDTPRFAKSDDAGTAHMGLPPGQHRLLYWHPLLDGPALRSQPMRVGSDGGTTELTLQLKAD